MSVSQLIDTDSGVSKSRSKKSHQSSATIYYTQQRDLEDLEEDMEEDLTVYQQEGQLLANFSI